MKKIFLISFIFIIGCTEKPERDAHPTDNEGNFVIPLGQTTNDDTAIITNHPWSEPSNKVVWRDGNLLFYLDSCSKWRHPLDTVTIYDSLFLMGPLLEQR